MPKLKTRTISFNDSTKTIITCWHDSLSEAGLIRPRQFKEGEDVSAGSFYEYEPTADSNTCNALLFSRLGERQSASLGESASRFIKGFFNGATGEYSTLCKDEFSIADNDMLEFWREYQTQHHAVLMALPDHLLSKRKIDEERLTRQKINDPHILASEILQRATLYIISEQKLNDNDHLKYLAAIEFFINKICKETLIFKEGDGNYDAFSRFLLENHKSKFLDNFKFYIAHQKQANLHQDTIRRVGEYILMLSETIKKQLVVYWEPKTVAGKIQESTYLGTLETIEARKKQEAIRRLEEASRAHTSSSSSSSVVRGAQLVCSSPEEMLVSAAEILKEPHRASITELYALLVQLEKIKSMHDNIAKLFSAASWLSTFFLKLGTFVEFLRKFHDSNTSFLTVGTKLKKDSAGSNALLDVGAHSVDALSDKLLVIHQQANRIDHPEHKIELKRDLSRTINNILLSQNELGICMIDPSYVGQFCGQLEAASSDSRHDSLRYEQYQGQSSIRMLELPPQRNTSPIIVSEAASELSESDDAESQEEPIIPKKAILSKASSIVVENPNIVFGRVLGFLKSNNHTEVMRMLGHEAKTDSLVWCARLSNLQNVEGRTLLHAMIEDGNYVSVRWLLKNNVDIFIADKTQTNSLKLAARHILRDKSEYQGFKIFFKMCQKAGQLFESLPINDEKIAQGIEPLSSFCSQTAANFGQYNQIQKQRIDTKLWGFKRAVKGFFGADLTVTRAEELADAYTYLLEFSKTLDNDILQEGLETILKNKKLSENSDLHKILKQVLKNFSGFSFRRQMAYNAQQAQKEKPQQDVPLSQAPEDKTPSRFMTHEEHERILNAREAQFLEKIELLLKQRSGADVAYGSISSSSNSIFAQSLPSSSSVDSVNSEQETRMMPFKMD